MARQEPQGIILALRNCQCYLGFENSLYESHGYECM